MSLMMILFLKKLYTNRLYPRMALQVHYIQNYEKVEPSNIKFFHFLDNSEQIGQIIIFKLSKAIKSLIRVDKKQGK